MIDKDEDDYSFAKHLIASSSDEEDEKEEKGGNQVKNSDDDDDDDDEKEEDSIAKYRSLLLGINKAEENKNDKDLEVSWIPQEEEEKEQENTEELTPWEKYLKKKKDKKKMKKQKNTEENEEDIPDDVDMNDPFFVEEFSNDPVSKKKDKKKKKKPRTNEDEPEDKITDLELLVMDSDDDSKHFNFKTIVEEETKSKSKKKKWKNKKKEKKVVAPREDTFDVDVNDDRFSAIFSRAEFNIDPSEQNFKKTKGMEKLIGEKQKRIQTGNIPEAPSTKKSKLDPEISASLKSVKNKWEKNARKKKSSS